MVCGNSNERDYITLNEGKYREHYIVEVFIRETIMPLFLEKFKDKEKERQRKWKDRHKMRQRIL